MYGGTGSHMIPESGWPKQTENIQKVIIPHFFFLFGWISRNICFRASWPAQRLALGEPP